MPLVENILSSGLEVMKGASPKEKIEKYTQILQSSQKEILSSIQNHKEHPQTTNQCIETIHHLNDFSIHFKSYFEQNNKEANAATLKLHQEITQQFSRKIKETLGISNTKNQSKINWEFYASQVSPELIKSYKHLSFL